MAYRNEWTGLFSLFYVRFLTTADSHALVFKALGFCGIGSRPPNNEREWSSVFSSCDKMTSRVLLVYFYRFIVLHIYL